MSKLIAFFMLLFFVATILSAAMEGSGGVNSTRLTADVTTVATTFNVASTDGFLKAGYLTIGNEKVRYSNKTATTFTGITRNWADTSAASHSRNSKVYNNEAQVINSILGFDVASTGSTVGSVSLPLAVKNFVFITVPRLVTWDFSWLRSDGMVWVRMPLAIITGAFAIYLGWQMASALGGVLQSIFVRP